MNYDLEQRTLQLSRNIISICKDIRITIINDNIIRQLLRSSQSIGANYREANGAVSTKDFANKIHICKKEAQETKYWLELLSEFLHNEKLSEVGKETNELVLIFNRITFTLKKNVKKH